MPLGHLGVNRYDLIDIDECGLFVTTCNRHYGHAYVGKRATEVRACGQAKPHRQSEAGKNPAGRRGSE